ncbi:MAG TPA: TerB family tellurite resistance protein [Verrucomicrobiae bacterium]
MNTTIKDFTEAQKHALLDLTMLAMYADGHLASAEDARVHRLLENLGYVSEYDRNTQYDASIARVSRHALTAVGAKEHAISLAQTFTTPQQRLKVHELLNDLTSSDSKVSLQEGEFLSVVREALKA